MLISKCILRVENTYLSTWKFEMLNCRNIGPSRHDESVVWAVAVYSVEVTLQPCYISHKYNSADFAEIKKGQLITE